MKFSIKQLLLVFVYVAVFLVALLNAGQPFAAGFVQLVNFIVLVGIAYGIWLTTGERRAFRVGFLGWVVGGLMFALAASPYSLMQSLAEHTALVFRPRTVYSPPSNSYVLNSTSPVIYPVPATSVEGTPADFDAMLPATRPTTVDVATPVTAAEPTFVPLPSTVAPQVSAAQPPLPPPATSSIYMMQTPADLEWQNGFTTIGTSLLMMLFGLVGGWVTVLVYRKRQSMLKSSSSQTE